MLCFITLGNEQKSDKMDSLGNLAGTPTEGNNASGETHDGELIQPSFVPNNNDR